MQKAIFLDRDGVINNDTGHYYIYRESDFVLNTGFIEGLQICRDLGYIFIVISNQGGIDKGVYTKVDVAQVHAKFLREMQNHQIEITDIYFCPHHSGMQTCLCRKPNSLMFEKAIARYTIDVKNSYMIGDSERDIEAAEKVGLHTIKIESNQSLLSVIDQIKQ